MPVLVVGNIVVGGAGKTPTVIALVRAFQAAGRRPGVISRGHGRSEDEIRQVFNDSSAAAVGDEPLLIHLRTGVPVWVGRDRNSAALALCRHHPDVDVLLSDDGLQHRALARDGEVLVFDRRGIGNGLLLPVGPLREPLPTSAGTRQRVLYSDGLQSTRLAGPVALRSIERAWPLSAWHARQPAAAVRLQNLVGRHLLAVAGLAVPERFFAMLEDAGLVIERLPLPDHYPYGDSCGALPWPVGTADVLTTEKDAVKLISLPLGQTRVWVVPLDLTLPPGFAAELLTLLPMPTPVPTP